MKHLCVIIVRFQSNIGSEIICSIAARRPKKTDLEMLLHETKISSNMIVNRK